MSFYELSAEREGYFYLRKGRTEAEATPHFHSAAELLFCTDGEQSVSVNGETRLLKKGDAAFCDSYAVHSLKKADCTLYVFLGDKRFFEPVFASFGGKIPPAFFRFENERLLDTLYEICRKAKKNEAGMYETNEGAIKILLSAIAEEAPFEKRQDNKQSALVNALLRFVTEHLHEELSLTRLASVFNYSHEHLSRILHRYLKENWNAYVARLRVREAERMLKADPSRSVLEIAFLCGFESPNTFYRAYKKEFGKAPREK